LLSPQARWPAGLAAPLAATGFSIDPAIMKWTLIEQDGGTWHVASDSLPPISVHSKEGAIAYNFGGYKFDGIFDPALATFKSAQQDLDKTDVEIHGPKVDETIAIGPLHATQTAAPAQNGAASLAVHEEIANLSANVSVIPGEGEQTADAKPAPVSLQSATTLVDVSADGAPIRKALDLWAFLAAYPSRSEIAANEQAFKTLLRALLPADFKLTEKVEMKEIAVAASQGRFAIASGKFALTASAAPGANGSAEYDLAVDGLTLPTGLLAPEMSNLAPNAFNIDVRANGFDIGAGADEAIKDMHFDGDGPVISEAGRAQILAKMKGSGPITIDLLPSHIVAPRVDVTFEGQVHLEGARPSGVLKIHARNFDRTVAALKAVGPLATPQMSGGLALARLLAKSEADGSLTWVAEYSADGAIKVNGMPLPH
jgi:hypothetical protein